MNARYGSYVFGKIRKQLHKIGSARSQTSACTCARERGCQREVPGDVGSVRVGKAAKIMERTDQKCSQGAVDSASLLFATLEVRPAASGQKARATCSGTTESRPVTFTSNRSEPTEVESTDFSGVERSQKSKMDGKQARTGHESVVSAGMRSSPRWHCESASSKKTGSSPGLRGVHLRRS